MKTLILGAIFFLTSTVIFGQQHQQYLEKINSHILQGGAANDKKTLLYFPLNTTLEKNADGYIYRFRLDEIKKIAIKGSNDFFVVTFYCNEEKCINITNKDLSFKMGNEIAFNFENEFHAKGFMNASAEMAKNEFQKTLELDFGTLSNKNESSDVTKIPEPAQEKVVAEKPALVIDDSNEKEDAVAKRERLKEQQEEEKAEREEEKALRKEELQSKGNNKNKEEINDEVAEKNELEGVCKGIVAVLESGMSSNFSSIKGEKSNEGTTTFSSKIRLKNAKKNYISTFKNAPCFMAEMKNSRSTDELGEQFLEIKDALLECLPTTWEEIDHSDDPIYDKGTDDVYHTEFVDEENSAVPSITLQITPDGNKKIFFIRIGKR
ncbi:MAG: hypothetical protein KA275_04060 [Chitinophagaceae bacterium]|nr:hypothetical protein [Chitinophagaceae bacterium]